MMQADGRPTCLEACQQFLFVFTEASRLCIWSLTGREAKPYGGAGRVVDLPPDLSLVSMRCNCDGSKVSFVRMLCLLSDVAWGGGLLTVQDKVL